ncbi:MAG: FAD-dependent thymidylate synthase, partial [Candidatus Diapherotrites archaeon]|nr:FAD-dependent thymidylate synthase [Candidatus Diapherotrites archaeon]
GALFSRYSRTDKSLRRLLLDEFINAPEMGFKEIVGHQVSKGETELVAIQKAEEFYDRVLVGYGDDSVAELGGAHIAVEQISNIATKVLEDARIGLSPLEKSSRYVYYDNKIDGEFQFYKDPKIMESKHADAYLELNNELFEEYSKLIPVMKKFAMEKFPQTADVSDRAYQSTIKAKACDVLRVFLPASTLTNMGIYGNGRAFEYLLTKMYAHPLTEIQNIAESMQKELEKVIPSFVKRANDKYGQRTINYMQETRKGMETLTEEFLGKENSHSMPEKQEEVVLVEYDKDAEDKVLTGIFYQHTDLSENEIKKKVHTLNSEQRKKVIQEFLSRRENRRHKPGRALENTYYTLDILADYGVYRDLQRHRMLTQERQLLTTKHGYYTPVEMKEIGAEKVHKDLMQKADTVFNAIAKDFRKEAQYVVPFGYRIRWYFKMNLREVYHFTELRSVPQGHPNYRRIAQKVFLETQKVHPALAEYMKFVDLKEYALERLEAEKKQDKKLQELDKKYGKI